MLAALWLAAGAAAAQDYPNRLLRFIVPNTPGSTQDTLARTMGNEMSRLLGQPIVVENKPGADSTIGYEYVAKTAPADGYTLASVNVTGLASLPATSRDLRFDPLKDLPPVIGIGESRFVLASAASLPWKTLPELVAHAKANPGKLNFGASVPIVRLPMEVIIRHYGLDIAHIPYSASAPYVQALIVGEIQMGIIPEGLAIAQGDKLRVLAVTGEKRRPPFLDVPTFAELGLGQIHGTAFSLNVRAGTPKPIVDKLYATAKQALEQPEMKANLAKMQLEISAETPEAAAANLAAQATFFSDTARAIGLRPQ
jgi:tripartite-type tricarboxylate transporter receptor subunit TctC